MRCGRCGNENDAANRFCGMCGAALVPTARPAGQAPSQAAAPVAAAPIAPAPRPAPAERPAAPASASNQGRGTGASSAGTSILGLNTPEFYADRSADGERDVLRPSSNLDYLLEDEDEEKPSRGLGKLILIVAALALMVGFGYLHWKQGGFDWLNAGDKKAAALKPAAGAASTGTESGNATAANPPDAGNTPATGGAAGSGPASAGDAGAAQATPSQTTSQGAASDAASPAASPQSVPQQSVVPQSATPQTQSPDPNLPSSASQAAGSDSAGASPAAAVPETPVRTHAAAKPVAKPVDLVTEAERYIYGRGVRQDCDHGLRLLKPAATRSNPKAMISLGALYATGTCTPRDLPTAYRWFALALHQEPDNQALQNDLQKLWSQMTQPERQLAIKLSQ